MLRGKERYYNNLENRKFYLLFELILFLYLRIFLINLPKKKNRVASTKAVDRYVDFLIESYTQKGIEKSEARITGSLGLRQLVKLSKEKVVVGWYCRCLLLY